MKKKNILNEQSSLQSPYVTEYTKSNIFLVSYIKHSTNQSLRDYSSSYQSAVEAILEPIAKKGHSEAIDDLLLLPVLFLWRQIIELELKRYLYILDFRVNGHNTFETHHNLEKLYIKIVPLIKSTDLPDEVVETFVSLKKLVDFYHFYDPGSYSFRYPQDKKQEIIHFNKQQQYIDIESLYKDIKDLVNLISYSEYTLDEMYDNTIA